MTKTTSRAFNFSAGPAILPEVVLEQIQNEMLSLPSDRIFDLASAQVFLRLATGVRISTRFSMTQPLESLS